MNQASMCSLHSKSEPVDPARSFPPRRGPMRTNSLRSLALLLSIGGAIGVVNAQEQTAAVVAARVQTFYDQTTSVEASFGQHFWSRAYNRTQSSRGTLRASRPGRVRFDYATPAGKVVVSDRGSFLFYEPGENGGPGQYYRGDTDAASTALGFLIGTARLERDFTYSLRTTSASTPANTDGLELRPRRPSPHFRRIVLYVDNRPASLGVVHRVAIEDPEGNWNRFDFSGMRFNGGVGDDVFHFTPPSGAHEISAPGH